MSATPASLLERLRDPEAEEAWAKFVALYTPLLFHWVRRVGLNEADAADLVQDVFAVLVRKLPEFVYDPARGGFRGWLRTVTLNKWRERQRRLATQGTRTEAVDLNGLIDSSKDEPFWETEYRQELTRRVLRIMQSDFEPTTWKACWECVVEGRSTTDVGRELGLSAGAVRVARFRVLYRLRRELEGLLD